MKKNVIITGTSRGIGLELVRIFAEHGHHVLALSRNEKPVLKGKFQNTHAFSFDVTKTEDLEKASDFVKQNWKHVDILINNSGKLGKGNFEDLSIDQFREVYEVNVFGVAELSRKMLPFMDERSHVVNISSIGGVQGSVKFPGLSAYSSSKGALITLTEMLAEEYKENGPSFNVLALGAVQTEMLEEAFPGYEAPITAAEMASYIYNFSLDGHHFYNGKLLQVSKSTP